MKSRKPVDYAGKTRSGLFGRLCVAFVVALVAVFALAVAPQAARADDDDMKTSWTHEKSKRATNLYLNDDGQLVSDVTLTLGTNSSDYSTDVVFVLDVSDDILQVAQQVMNLTRALQEAQSKTNATINVGVVCFKGSAATLWDGMIPASQAVTQLQNLAGQVMRAYYSGQVSSAEQAFIQYLQ